MTQPLFSAKCPPQKPYNTVRRSREYLTPEEVEHLLRAARRQGRYKQRNATLILLMYRHGLAGRRTRALTLGDVRPEGRRCSMSSGSKTASRPCIPYAGQNSGRCANSIVTRPGRPICLSRNGGAH